MAKRKQPTFADYLVIAITPALIMLLVGSLVFFLLTAFYDGRYDGRLRYIFSLFIFAAVLIGRISIEEGKEQASIYGIALAGAVWMTVGRFSDTSSLGTALIIALVWFAAHKLTWDCTLIDEAEEAESGGLLQSAGFESATASDLSPDQTLSRDTVADDEATEQEEIKTWANLWDRWVKNRKRPHSPGVWVIYFCLATLPLFGIGQWAISTSDMASRRSAFHCLLVYVASAMALLGTTSFLGIRRYLRQRKLEMPIEMAMTWALGSGGIVLAILLVASFLPRPRPAYSITDAIGSRNLDRAGRYAMLRDEGVDSGDGNQHDNESEQQSDRTTKKQSDQKTASDEGKRSTSDGKSEDEQGKDSGNESGKNGSKNQSKQGENKNSQSDEKPSDRAGQKTGKKDDSGGNSERRGQKQDGERDQNSARSDRENQREGQEASKRPNQLAEKVAKLPQQIMNHLGNGLSGLLKLLYWLVVIVAVLWFCYKFAGPILAALRAFWSDLAQLFGRTKPKTESEEGEAVAEALPQRKPFAAYSDPTASGKKMSDRDLVRYTFLALEAWAHEHGCTRKVDETPFEFARRIARKFPSMGASASYLVQLYDRMAYAASAPRMARERIMQLWQCMRG